jgi:16S rRNA (cytosine967-C5)-methyltransferase
VPTLAELQEQLLVAALAALAPGGVLAYVTCSPHPDETTRVVERALARRPELVRLDTAAALRDVVLVPLDADAGGGAVQLWPHRHGTDAMFIQLLSRPLGS